MAVELLVFMGLLAIVYVIGLGLFFYIAGKLLHFVCPRHYDDITLGEAFDMATPKHF